MDQLNLLLAALSGIAASAIIGVVKKLEGAADAAFVSKLGNLTPILVTILSIVLPKVTTLLHLTQIPDAQAFANAPVATTIAIVSRELLVKLNPPKA